MSALEVFLAIICGITAYSMLNIGLALEKKGAATLPKIEGVGFFQNIKNFLTNKIWLIGFLLTNIQWLFFLLALEFGSLSLVTPMMGIGLTALVIFSYFYLKEPVAVVEMVGIIIIIIGVVVLGVTSNSNTEVYTIDGINLQLKAITSILFLVITTAIIVLLPLLSIISKFAYADIAFGIAGGMASGVGAIFSKAFTSGIDMTNFGASIIEAVARWEWWIFLVLLLLFNIVSMAIPQVGFQKGRAIIVTPLFAIMGLIIPVLGGAIIFNEWSGQNIGTFIAKVVALLAIVSGVAILSIYNVKEPSIKEEKDELVLKANDKQKDDSNRSE